MKNRIKIKEITPGEIELRCTHCGEFITHSNDSGMYCDNECGIHKDKILLKIAELVWKIIKILCKRRIF